jgi:hypothetical protein
VDDDRAVAQLVQFPRVEFRGFVAQIAMGKEELRRALDARPPLPDPVDLAFPPASEARNDFVLAGESAPGNEIEGFDSQTSILTILFDRPPALEGAPDFSAVGDGR